MKYRGSYALVICNRASPAPGNSGDLVQQIPAKSPTLQGLLIGKTTAVLPRSLLFFIFSFHCPFCLYKANPGYFPRTAMEKLWSKHRSFPRLSPALPRGWVGGGAPWLQMTSALYKWLFQMKFINPSMSLIHFI